jgi:hypothetical protein
MSDCLDRVKARNQCRYKLFRFSPYSVSLLLIRIFGISVVRLGPRALRT